MQFEDEDQTDFQTTKWINFKEVNNMLSINEMEVETDKDGYLFNSQQWNEDVAQALH